MEEQHWTRADQAMQTRKNLFEAAYALLEENEFSAITIRDIVRRAGVSIGTFYLYFPSKLDVYYQTYSIADEYFIVTVAPMLTHARMEDNLLLYLDQYAIYNAEYTSFRLTKLLYNADNTCFLRGGDPGMVSVLRSVLQHGRKNGELNPELEVEDAVTFILDSMRGLVYSWCLHDASFDLRTSMKQYAKLFYRAICYSK